MTQQQQQAVSAANRLNLSVYSTAHYFNTREPKNAGSILVAGSEPPHVVFDLDEGRRFQWSSSKDQTNKPT